MIATLPPVELNPKKESKFNLLCQFFNKIHMSELFSAITNNYSEDDKEFCSACEEGDLARVLEMIQSENRPADFRLIKACACGRVAIARAILERHPDFATRYLPILHLALMIACQCGYGEMALLLIKHGADDYLSAFRSACMYGRLKMIHLLIDGGFFNQWEMGLRNACIHGEYKVAQLMINKGASCEGTLEITNDNRIALLVIEHGASDWGAFITRDFSPRVKYQAILKGAPVGILKKRNELSYALNQGLSLQGWEKSSPGKKIIRRRKMLSKRVRECLDGSIHQDIIKYIIDLYLEFK